jgi:signal transduction histidine kinase
MLDHKPSPDRRLLLLNAIGDAAIRGGKLTTHLLAGYDHAVPSNFDLNGRIRHIEPLVRALAGQHIDVLFDLCPRVLQVRLTPPAFDAVLLELIANACSAISGSGRITVRTRQVGARIWLAVADSGSGMGRTQLRRLMNGDAVPAAHGTGFGRVRHFLQSAHGHLHVRSGEGRGTTVVMLLPAVLKLSAVENAPICMGSRACGPNSRVVQIGRPRAQTVNVHVEKRVRTILNGMLQASVAGGRLS